MSYSRIATPRFYVDTPNWKISRGLTTSNFSKITGTFNTGSTAIDLIDMKPLNRCSFDTSGNPTTHIILQWDAQATSTADKFDYVAILNHNLVSAEGKIRVAYKATAFTGAGEGTTVSNVSVIVNGTESSEIVTPSSNGSTILTFDEVTSNDGRYWAIEIEDDANFSATDLEIGCIMMGEYYDMPHTPEYNIKRNFEYDGVTVQKAIGGGEFANATHFGGDDFVGNIFGQPFRQRATTYFRRVGGRIGYNMAFKYLNDTDIMPSDLSAPWGDTAFHDIWNKTSGRFIPFIFAVDGTSTTMGDYIFARFNQDSFDATQVAPLVWDMNLKIRETW